MIQIDKDAICNEQEKTLCIPEWLWLWGITEEVLIWFEVETGWDTVEGIKVSCWSKETRCSYLSWEILKPESPFPCSVLLTFQDSTVTLLVDPWVEAVEFPGLLALGNPCFR